MSPGTRNGAPPQGPAAEISTATKPQDQGKGSATVAVLVAFAVRYLAAGEASLDWVVVKKCPLCGFSHRHVLFEVGASTIERAPGCARHRSYQVQITEVVPSAAQRRIRGAA